MSKNNSIHSSKVTIASLLIALGIIYGDIGTSPLYVLKSIIGTKVISEQLVYGGVSCIFWTLTIQTSIKYIWLTLQADNQGEGEYSHYMPWSDGSAKVLLYLLF